MPPLHPAFVHFPIALVGFSFIADLPARLLNRPSLRSAGFWSLIGALLGSIAAAATGYFDFGRDALGGTYRYVDLTWKAGRSEHNACTESCRGVGSVSSVATI